MKKNLPSQIPDEELRCFLSCLAVRDYFCEIDGLLKTIDERVNHWLADGAVGVEVYHQADTV